MKVYLDHNATTPVRPEVLDAMLPFLRDHFGNPNSIYSLGQQARAAVERAREKVARLLNAQPDEIVFTSCGSESDVFAIAGAARAALQQSAGAKKHIVTSAIEHDAVRILVDQLKTQGFEVTLVGVDRHGQVKASDVAAAIRPSTSIVSIMHANNEVGTIQPIAELARLCREKQVLFHTDAVQSVGRIAIDVRALGLDLLSLSGHKINAPKGVGALFIRRGVRLLPLIAGHQEKNRRGGTENVSGVVALGAACELAQNEMDAHVKKLLLLRKRLEDGCLKIEGSRLNGHPQERLAGTCHISFAGLDGHPLVVALDLSGICASSGPACSAGTSVASHVLEAMGVDEEYALGNLRLSLGWGSSDKDVDRLLEVLPKAVAKLREANKELPLAASKFAAKDGARG